MTVETLGHPSVLDELAAALAKAPPLGDWIDDAACARLGDRGADVFTADGVLDGDVLDAAVRVCRHCPVQQCATYAASDRVRAVGRGPAWGTMAAVRRCGETRPDAARLPDLGGQDRPPVPVPSVLTTGSVGGHAYRSRLAVKVGAIGNDVR